MENNNSVAENMAGVTEEQSVIQTNPDPSEHLGFEDQAKAMLGDEEEAKGLMDESNEGVEAFNPDELDFDSEGNEFDKTKFEELGLQLDDPNGISTDQAKGMLEIGLSPEQIKAMNDKFNAPKSPSEVKEVLAKSLTVEEKRNYKPLVGLLKEALPEELKSATSALMSEPNVVKILNAMYTHLKGGKDPNNVQTPDTKPSRLTAEEALSKYNEAVNKASAEGTLNAQLAQSLKKNLLARVSDGEVEKLKILF